MAGYTSFVDKAKRELREKKKDIAWLMGEFIAGKAALLAPVAEMAGGSLRQSIDHKEFESKGDIGTAVGSDIDYFIYVEKGTGIFAVAGNGRKSPWVYYDPKDGSYHYTQGMKPQPFLEKSVTKNINELRQIAEKVLRNWV